MQPIRTRPAGSPSIAMPHTNPPTAPMPVQTAYTVPMGNARNDWDMQNMLAPIAAKVAMLASGRVKPSLCFSTTTQTISNSPAVLSHAQGPGKALRRYLNALSRQRERAQEA